MRQYLPLVSALLFSLSLNVAPSYAAPTSNPPRAAQSCGSYLKNGKTVNIPCSLGKTLKSSIAAGQTCKAELKINGLTIRIRHQCVIKPSGKTGVLTVSEPTGSLQTRQQQLKPTINTLAQKYGVDKALAHAIITVESAYRSDVVSSKGAIGLMQLMPSTASGLNVSDPFNPQQNIDGGIRYLAAMLKQFNGDIHLAVAAYNAGPNAVIKYKNSIPPYAETQAYVKRVLSYRERYQNDWKKHIY